MFCINCGAKLLEGSKFCINCGSKAVFTTTNDNLHKVEPENSSEYKNKTTEEFDNVEHNTEYYIDYLEKFVSIQNKIDDYIDYLEKLDKKQPISEEFDNIQQLINDYIDNIEKDNKEQPIISKIYFLLDLIHKNIIYDNISKVFSVRKVQKEGKFEFFYNYKNSVKEVIKNKDGTFVGFSNIFQSICEKSGIDCKTMIYKNDTRKFNHQLNIVFDNGKKYYVDPTWGFIVDNSETLKQIYRGEINNPRTNEKLNYSPVKDKSVSKERNFMLIVFLSIPLLIIILVIINWLIKK